MFLDERLRYWAAETPDAAAVIFEGATISFRQMFGRVQNTAAMLKEDYDVRRGDRVAYLGINNPIMLDLVFACAQLGTIFTPFNSRLARDEYAYLISNAEPVVCFYDDNFKGVVTEFDGAECVFSDAASLHAHKDSKELTVPDHSEDNPLLLVYTSGTTGRPKGVLLSHRAVAANIENGHDLYTFAPGQNVLITLPLFHVGGLCILLLPALTHGATIHLHARFDPAATITTLEKDAITTTILVPAQLAAIMAHDAWSSSKFPALTHIVVGSSLIPLAQIQAWHERGIPVSQVYGATETGPSAIGLPIGDAMSKEGSAGKPVKLCSIEVRHRNGTACGTNEDGEIWTKGPNIMSGYWRSQAETDLVLQDGWYNTGDIGHCDEDGFFWIVDRSKDVIISGGENIYPAEVEAVALKHPAIAAIAVVGRSDLHWGETPVAAIELKPGRALDESELRNFFENRLARFKQPKSILFFEQLPRNGMGKIEKAAIRAMVNRPVDER